MVQYSFFTYAIVRCALNPGYLIICGNIHNFSCNFIKEFTLSSTFISTLATIHTYGSDSIVLGNVVIWDNFIVFGIFVSFNIKLTCDCFTLSNNPYNKVTCGFFPLTKPLTQGN